MVLCDGEAASVLSSVCLPALARPTAAPCEAVAETKRGLHVATKMGDDDLLIQDGTILSNPGAIGRQGEIHHTVGKPDCWRPFIKNDWGVQSVANRNYGHFFGARFGVP